MDDTSSRLQDLARGLDIALTDDQAARLHQYGVLLWEWNERMNLTRHTDWEKFVERDLLDSVRLAECLGMGEKVLDVGSGGGVPGIVLAILRPDLRVVLSESVIKKARALEDIVARLGLDLRVVAERGERVAAAERFDTVVFRGVGSLARVLRWFAATWTHIGRMVFIKGPKWVDERAEARHVGLLRGYDLRRLAHYHMPGTQSESVILSIRPKIEASMSDQ